jgi:hypothetical protein
MSIIVEMTSDFVIFSVQSLGFSREPFIVKHEGRCPINFLKMRGQDCKYRRQRNMTKHMNESVNTLLRIISGARYSGVPQSVHVLRIHACNH